MYSSEDARVVVHGAQACLGRSVAVEQTSPAEHYVLPGQPRTGAQRQLGNDGRGVRPMPSRSAIGELARADFEIGSRGQLHLAANVNSPELVRHEAAASRTELEQQLGKAVLSFEYPFGCKPLGFRRAMQAAGFAEAFMVGESSAWAGDDRSALSMLLICTGTWSLSAVGRMVGATR